MLCQLPTAGSLCWIFPFGHQEMNKVEYACEFAPVENFPNFLTQLCPQGWPLGYIFTISHAFWFPVELPRENCNRRVEGTGMRDQDISP